MEEENRDSLGNWQTVICIAFCTAKRIITDRSKANYTVVTVPWRKQSFHRGLWSPEIQARLATQDSHIRKEASSIDPLRKEEGKAVSSLQAQGQHSRGRSASPIALSLPENKYFDPKLFFITLFKDSRTDEVDDLEDFQNSIYLLLLRLKWPPSFSKPGAVQEEGKPDDLCRVSWFSLHMNHTTKRTKMQKS